MPMINARNTLLLCLFFIPLHANATIDAHKKGNMFVLWGWNNTHYENSDLHFKGENYDFTLKDVNATGEQSAISANDFLNPSNIGEPQSTFKVGYFSNDDYAISFGVDNFGCDFNENQLVTINGTINTGSDFDGTYQNDTINAHQEGFLEFNHSTGLKYFNMEWTHFKTLYSFSNTLHVSGLAGLGAGVVTLKSQSTLLNKSPYGKLHFSGWGSTLKAGIEMNYNGFFTRSEFKVGYLDLLHIRTSMNPSDKASQSFQYRQFNILIGYYF